MPKKPRFRPEITRVKLNPEQAVLACSCYQGWYDTGRGGRSTMRSVCVYGYGPRTRLDSQQYSDSSTAQS